MGLLNSDFKEKESKVKKAGIGSVQDSIYVPTGMDYLDYMSGNIEEAGTAKEFLNVGIPQGKIILYVGHSQSGKSTKAYQDSYALVKDLNGDVVIFDFERSTQNLEKRVMEVTGCSVKEFNSTFSVFKQEDLTIEYVKEFIFDIVEKKRALNKKCLVDYVDYHNNDIKIYPPTVLIIDSIPAIRTKELLENPKADNNMVHATLAKKNSEFLTAINNFLEPYNITLLVIGHITTKIVIDPYAPIKIQLPGLSKDENISGGNKFCYLASYAYKFTAGAEFKQDKEFYLKGRVVNCQILKSRSGYNEKKIPLAYIGQTGFSNEMTNYLLLKEAGLIKMNGKAGASITNMPDFKFQQKNFLTAYAENAKFRDKFNDLVDEYMYKIISNKTSTSSPEDEDMEAEFEE